MAADVYVVEMNTATFGEANMTKLSGSTGTPVTARYCTMDDAEPGQSNPIPIPDSGHTPSYWKNHLLYISGTTDGGGAVEENEWTYISSIRWYCDGTLFNWGSTATSGLVYIGSSNSADGCGVISGNYESGCGWVGQSGALMINHLDIDMSSNAENYDSLANAITVDDRKITPNDTAHFVWSKILVHQAMVGEDAASGNPGTETFTWVWDEVS